LTANFERTTNDIQMKKGKSFTYFSSLWDKTLAPISTHPIDKM